MIKIELISTGSELLSGRTVNRHAQVLGERLSTLGIALGRDTTLPDDMEQICEVLRSAMGRSNVVVISGGLGPTNDDITRDAVARVLGREVVMDDLSLRRVRKIFAKMGRELSNVGERQAMVVEDSEVLKNPVGLAPGMRIATDGAVLYLLPGPPREFQSILETYLMPWFEEQVRGESPRIETVFMITGIGESDVHGTLTDEGLPPAVVDLAFCAAPGRVEVRLSAEATHEAELETTRGRLRDLFGDYIFAEQRCGMEEAVGLLLNERGATVSTAESCTGGLIAHKLTAVSGSSAYFPGSLVTYSNEVKERELGVSGKSLDSFGAVSETVAREMAEGVRKKFGTDYGVSVTGIAGPTGGTAEKPVGLVYIGVADKDGTTVTENRLTGDREWIRERSANRALDLLRKKILGVSS